MNDARAGTTRTAGVVLLSLAMVATLVAAVIAVTGGFTFHLGGATITMHAVSRPVVMAIALGALGFRAIGGVTAIDARRMYVAVGRDAMLIAGAFAVVIFVATFGGGAHIGGSADASGYLSQARLWREGGFQNLDALRLTTPISHELTPMHGQYVFTPVGYQPAGPDAIVPGYPPGLPLHFALAGAIAGERAQFVITPLAAGGLVIVAFLIGNRLAGPIAALFSAFAVGSSPILLFQAAQPMSDAVAAFWWSLSVLLLLDPSKRRLFGAGIAAAIACFVRPNLFAMVPVIALMVWWWRQWRRDAIVPLATFAGPLALSAIGFTLLQRFLYGNAVTTGYGEVGSLFSLSHVLPNLIRYPRWAIFTQSALLIASLAAPMAIGRGWVAPAIDRTVATRVAWSGLLFFAALQAFYLLYLTFDDWPFFRFLLPALPWLLVLQSVAIAAAIKAIPLPTRGIAVILIAVLIASWGVGRARGLGAFRLHESEQRYLDVAGFARGLPPNAVFLSVQHSGSLAYYNRAPVLRWDWLDALEVDDVIATMTHNGHAVFAVLDEWEEQPFRTRFTGTNLVQRMGTPLFSAGDPKGVIVRVYAIRDA